MHLPLSPAPSEPPKIPAQARRRPSHPSVFLAGLLSALLLLAPTSAQAASLPVPTSSPTINVPLFLQIDNLWNQQPLGTCAGVTLDSAGCAVTSLAMVSAKYGAAVNSSAGYGMTPGILNAWLKDHGFYGAALTGGACLLEWGLLPTGIVYTGSDASFDHLDRELAAGRPVIAQVHNAGTVMHFVVITGSNGATYDINDPYFGQRLLDNGAKNAYSVDRFRYFAPAPLSESTQDYRAAAQGFFSLYGSGPATNMANRTNTRLADGRILLTDSGSSGNLPADSTLPATLNSGSNAGAISPSAQIYDPATGAQTPTGVMIDPGMSSPVATLLTDGRVLFIGTGARPEIYDPDSGTFRLAGPLLCPDCAQYTTTLLADGRVLLAGGYDAASDNAAPNEIYSPASGQFSLTGALISPRLFGSATRLDDGRVLIAGGLAMVGPDPQTLATVAPAEVYDPVSGLFSPAGPMLVPRALMNATLLSDGRVFFSGGYDATGAAISQDELFDPQSGTFGSVAP